MGASRDGEWRGVASEPRRSFSISRAYSLEPERQQYRYMKNWIKQKKLESAKCVWHILLAALVLRALVPLLAIIITGDYSVFHGRDTSSYMQVASEMVSSGEFSRNGTPELIRTPGYPAFLIPGLILGMPEVVTITLQIAVSCLTVYLVFQVAVLLFKRVETGCVCALMYAIEPVSILYASKLMTETIFTFLIVLFLYYLVRYLGTRARSELLAAAVALAASVYVRPISYFLPLMISVLLIVWGLAGRSMDRTRLSHVFLFLAVAMGSLGLWQIRNVVKTGYGGFSAVSDRNLYLVQGASVVAAQEGIGYYEVRERMGAGSLEAYLSRHPAQRGWDPGDRFRYMRKQGSQILLANPLLYSGIHLKGMLRTLLDPGAVMYLKLYKLYPEYGGLLGAIVDDGLAKTVTSLLREKPLVFWSSLALGLLLVLYIVLALRALVSTDLRYSLPIVLLLCLAVYFLVISGGPHSIDRYRHPIMPLFSILAGYGVSVVSKKRWRERWFAGSMDLSTRLGQDR